MFTVDVQIDGVWEIGVAEFNHIGFARALVEFEYGEIGNPARVINENTGKVVFERI